MRTQPRRLWRLAAPTAGVAGLLLLMLAGSRGVALLRPAVTAPPMCRAHPPEPLAAVWPVRGWEPGGLGLLDAPHLQPRPLPHRQRVSSRRIRAPRLPAGFQADLLSLLPRYRADFEEAARQSGVDWRLLAAMGYQESRWNPGARSPTGVHGLMMLTQDTAQDLGVDRDNARQSILGAGRLLQALYAQLPPRIAEPDRTAMVLAAYNQGIGHLQDARDVADLRGGNPDRWADVRQALPLLSHQLWVQTTKYGPARGTEAVGFVDGVHGYYTRLRDAAPEASTGAP